MRKRCLNKKFKWYHNYGGRGIKIAWKSFDEFYRDMGDSYQEDLTLERIDNDGDYCKNNCKWATRKEQARNTRQAPLVEWEGIKRTLAEWAERLNIKPSTLRQRYYVYKWDINKCLTFN